MSFLDFVRAENNRATVPIAVVCETLDDVDLLPNFFVRNAVPQSTGSNPSDLSLSFRLDVRVFFSDR